MIKVHRPFVAILFCGIIVAFASPADSQTPKWIGYTKDNRPDQWSSRGVTFNRPPDDISSWKPTAKELRSTPRKSFPSPLLRKTFGVSKPVQSAEVVISGVGLYELYLNGEKVGDHVLAPAQTSYEERVFSNTFDITTQIKTGKNAVGVMLGNGFYGQNIAFAPNLSYGAPRALVAIKITYHDGSQSTISSDPTWRASTGPILFDNVYFGETFDAREVTPGWSTANFDAAGWSPAQIMDSPTDRIEKQRIEPMRKVRRVTPIAVLPAEEGWIIDMGENMTGWLQIAAEESAGTVIKMRFAEHLMPDGKNIDTASTGIHATGGEQMDIYICQGDGKETWEPRFTYHGFRYVQVTGVTSKPDVNQWAGWWVRSDVDRIGSFECSDELINKFYEVSIRTIEGNLQGLLSDCPHRERCAWMGDIHAVGEASSYNFDLRKFWPKVAADIETMLGKGGGNDRAGLPRDPRAPCNIAVGKRNCGQARPDWGAATVLVPWYGYLHYGDVEIVKEAWPMMQGWLAYLDQYAVKNGIIQDGFGDWCPPGSNTKKDTPSALTSTALYYQSLVAMQQMATAIGKTAESKQYAQQAAVIKDAFNKNFYKVTDVPVRSEPSNATIKITQATYGALSKQMDVSRLIQEIADSGRLTFNINNPLVGKDPAPGLKKTLELEYEVNGEPQKQTVSERSDVYFIRNSVAGYGSQTGSAVALFSGLVPDGDQQAVADGLADMVMKKSGGHYTTGIFGHRPLYTVLNDYGHADVTRHLWRITDWPSLGFMTEQHGLTTWPEVPFDWQPGRRYLRNSFNHPMHSGFAATFHESIGGIRPDPENPGFKTILLRPTFLPGLQWVKSSLRSPQGLIVSDWKRDNEKLIWKMTIPDGSDGRVDLSSGNFQQATINGNPIDPNAFELTPGQWTVELTQ